MQSRRATTSTVLVLAQVPRHGHLTPSPLCLFQLNFHALSKVRFEPFFFLLNTQKWSEGGPQEGVAEHHGPWKHASQEGRVLRRQKKCALLRHAEATSSLPLKARGPVRRHIESADGRERREKSREAGRRVVASGQEAARLRAAAPPKPLAGTWRSHRKQQEQRRRRIPAPRSRCQP